MASPRRSGWPAVLSFALVTTWMPCQAQDSHGRTEAENAEVERAADFQSEGKFEEAEAIYRKLLEAHPQDVWALKMHIESLDEVGRHAEVEVESRRLLAINPTDSDVEYWLGIAQLYLGRPKEAVQTLERARALDPQKKATLTWLATAQIAAGESEKGNLTVEKILQGKTQKQQGRAINTLAHNLHEVGDKGAAIEWWKRSAALGDRNAAEWLTWVYATGDGVKQDLGDQAYWEQRADKFPPLIPQWKLADEWTRASGGWFLVLVAIASATILPVMMVSIFGWLFSRRLTTDPAVHWSERARRSYPYQSMLGTCALLTPVIYYFAAKDYPGSQLPVPHWLFTLAITAIALISANWIVVKWARRYRDDPGTAMQNLQSLGVIFLFYLSTFALFGMMAYLLPQRWNLQAGLVILATILGFCWLQYGGWIRVLRLFRAVVPADAELTGMARDLAVSRGLPPPRVWLFFWRKANAFAFPFSNAILVTVRLREILSAEEMKAVVAHEMAHLCEDKTTNAMRLLVPLLLMPLFMFKLWNESNWWVLIATYFVLLATMFVFRKRRRKMEERADTFGSEASVDPTIYPRALSRIYEENLIPAVMPGKRQVHPHLYDRMLASGITPDFPRPKPPARWMGLVSLLAMAANYVLLWVTWHVLF